MGPTGSAQPAPGDPAVEHQAGRYPCFDGIRAVAALMVIVYHAVFFTTWFETPGGSVLANLNAGVWVFFVTSGFLLYLPFARAHRDGSVTIGWRGYALRRASRIYPAYWVALAFFTFVIPKATIVGLDGFLLNVTLTQTYVHQANPFFLGIPPAWSLVVEISFYVFLPFYATLIGYLARTRRALRVEAAGIVVLGAIGLAAVIGVAAHLDRHAPWLTVLPQHITAFALGMGLAVLRTYPLRDTTVRTLDRLGRPAWAWWGAAIAMLFVIPFGFDVPVLRALTAEQSIALDVGKILIGLFVVVPAVLGPQDHGVIRRVLRSRVLVFLGLVSYGLYLWQWFVLLIVQGDWFGWGLREGSWGILLLVGFPVILFAATISWYVVERPILRWTHGVTRSKRSPAAPS